MPEVSSYGISQPGSELMRRVFVVTICALALLVAGARAQSDITAMLYASGFSRPVAFVQDPVQANVQYVVEQGGTIRTLVNRTTLATPFLTLSGISTAGEQGLLGLAFAPDYAASGRFYVNFTNAAGHTVVARFVRSAGNALVADPNSRFDLRWNGAGNPAYITQPFANHNGGNLAFGPEGYLYIGMGDGGSGGDPNNNAQTGTTLLGKMLRVDVSVPDNDPIGYRVPANNPFVSTAYRPEIWAFGYRNPWRYSFDDVQRGGTGALIVGDVGQNAWEEIDYEPLAAGGRNYGWRRREGAHDYDLSLPAAYLPLTEPIYNYDHTVGQAVTGGFVYRGSILPATYRGRYFFADFGQGRVWSSLITPTQTGEGTWSGLVEHTAALSTQTAIGLVSSFGVDGDGELYILSYGGGVGDGRILKIVPVVPSAPRNFRVVR